MNDQGIAFHTFIPSEPSIKSKSQEILTTTEYVKFILSAFGTWFGISVLGLNPFTSKNQKRTEPKRNNVFRISKFTRELKKKQF